MLKFGAITIDASHPKSFAKKLATGFHTTVSTDVRPADSCFTVDASKLYEAMLKEVCNKADTIPRNVLAS